ncbi:MAG: Ig-like domain-containing protein [Clostridia bacterium]|nr:Ig-like domain-containing protein [Clostridia bacterium]
MRKYFISALIAILACVMVFAGCSSAEKEIQVILECEGEYVGTYTVSTFNNAVVPEQSKDGYRFLGWSVKEDWTEGVDSEDLLSENTGLIRYDDVKDYIEDGKDSITLYAIFGEIPENDLVIAWYDKETTSGLNEEYVEAFEENLYTYLDSQGYTASEMSIVIRGYSGDVGTTCSAILKDGDVDIMIGWSSTSNLTGTGGMDESSILENTSKITIGSKARYAARLTDTDLCNIVYTWILAEYGASGDTSDPVEPETPSETADLVIGWYAKTATTGLDADLMATFETALNTYLTSIGSASTVLIREYSGDYSVAEVGAAVNSNGDVDILIGMGKNITSSGGITTLERIDDYYINSISRNIARLTDEELTVTVFEWMQTYEVRVIFNSAYTVSEVTISGATSVAVDSSITLTAALTVNDGSVYNSNAITWTSSSESVATVSADGVVTGIAEGAVTITAAAYGVSGEYTVEVTQDAAPVTVSAVTISNENSDSVKTGSTRTLTATVAMTDGVTEYSGDITWASSDESIATVTDGVVTGVKSGEVTITATAEGVTSAAYTITVADLVIGWYDLVGTSGLNDLIIYNFNLGINEYLTTNGYDTTTVLLRAYDGDVATSCAAIMADGDVDIMLGWGKNISTTGGMTEGTDYIEHVSNISMGGKSRYITRITDSTLVNAVFSWVQTDDGLSYLATPTYDTSVVIGWYAKTSTTGLDSTIMAAFETALNTYLEELGITDVTVTIRSYSADYSVAEVGTAVNTDGDVDILLGMGSNITSTGKIETLELVDDYTMGEKSRNIARLTDDPLTNLIFEWLQTDEVRAIFAA